MEVCVWDWEELVRCASRAGARGVKEAFQNNMLNCLEWLSHYEGRYEDRRSQGDA